MTPHGRKKIEQSQVAAAIEASKRDKEELDLRKAVNASLKRLQKPSAKSSASKILTRPLTTKRLCDHQNKNKTESKASDYGGESKTADIEKPRPASSKMSRSDQRCPRQPRTLAPLQQWPPAPYYSQVHRWRSSDRP